MTNKFIDIYNINEMEKYYNDTMDFYHLKGCVTFLGVIDIKKSVYVDGWVKVKAGADINVEGRLISWGEIDIYGGKLSVSGVLD